ncbi:hypothetical protein PQX77_007740 [Marasmius sp. AFHP31]|nr:hypothetical protein PQX77_007740 [Marasmius sp. AFHP31]
MAKEELFLDPLIVSQRYHLCYVVVGSLAAVLWDIMIHLRADFRLFRKSGGYHSRLSTVRDSAAESVTPFVVSFPPSQFSQASQVGSYCGVLQTVVTSLGSLHYTSTGLLHLLRVRVVYLDRPWVLRFFCLSWVISSGTTIAIGPFLLDGATIAGNSCMHTHLNTTLQQISFAINIIQGTCIVLATSSGFVLTPADFPFVKKIGFFQRVKASVTANGLPAFSKSLLRHGQGYYL